jgi:nitroreductase
MDIFEAIRNRRSIRKYDDAKQVPKELIEKVVDAARWAPSAGNHQPIEVVVVSDQKKREKMAEISGYARYLKYSPIALVVCINLKRSEHMYGELGREHYSPQDASAAIENMMLAATALGLGTCWNSLFEKDMVKEMLNLPEDVKPFAILPLGYPLKIPEPPSRRPLEEVLHWEIY